MFTLSHALRARCTRQHVPWSRRNCRRVSRRDRLGPPDESHLSAGHTTRRTLCACIRVGCQRHRAPMIHGRMISSTIKKLTAVHFVSSACSINVVAHHLRVNLANSPATPMMPQCSIKSSLEASRRYPMSSAKAPQWPAGRRETELVIEAHAQRAHRFPRRAAPK